MPSTTGSVEANSAGPTSGRPSRSTVSWRGAGTSATKAFSG